MRDAEAWFEEGCRHLQLSAYADSGSDFRSDHEDAAAAFEQVVRLQPDHANAWFQLGRSRATLGQRTEAATAYFEAIRIRPDEVEYWIHSAIVLMDLERYGEGLEACREVLRRDAGNPEIHFRLGVALEFLSRPEEALEAYRKAVRAASGTPPIRSSAHSLFPPRALEAAFRRAGVLAALGRRKDARTAFRAAFRLGPWKGGPLGYRSTTWFYDLLARHEEARAAYEEAVGREPDPAHAWSRAADAMLCAKRGVEALRFSEEAIAFDPDRELAWFRKAEALVQLGRREEAIAAYRESLRRNPGWPAATARLRVVQSELDPQGAAGGRAEE